MEDLVAHCNALRQARGLLGIEQLMALTEIAVTIHDPFSTLIGKNVTLGPGSQIYPNCMILSGPKGSVVLGENNLLYPSTLIQAQAGTIHIGSGNCFGPGGFTASTMAEDETLRIGDHGRYTDGAGIHGGNILGSGSQILGQIAVYSCELGAGGSFQEADPDKRGAVLKGLGRAKTLKVATGKVIQAFGLFTQDSVVRQRAHHPVPLPG